jgi:hypothetical protein
LSGNNNALAVVIQDIIALTLSNGISSTLLLARMNDDDAISRSRCLTLWRSTKLKLKRKKAIFNCMYTRGLARGAAVASAPWIAHTHTHHSNLGTRNNDGETRQDKTRFTKKQY